MGQYVEIEGQEFPSHLIQYALHSMGGISSTVLKAVKSEDVKALTSFYGKFKEGDIMVYHIINEKSVSIKNTGKLIKCQLDESNNSADKVYTLEIEVAMVDSISFHDYNKIAA